MLSIEDRLAALEKSNRRLRIALVAAALGGAALAGFGFTRPTPVPDLIQAKKFEVVNDHGTPVVWMETGPKGGSIHTTNREGKRLFTATADEDGTGRIATLDGNGHDLVVLHSTTSGGMITTFNTKGAKVLSVGVMASGDPNLSAYGPAGETRAKWPN